MLGVYLKGELMLKTAEPEYAYAMAMTAFKETDMFHEVKEIPETKDKMTVWFVIIVRMSIEGFVTEKQYTGYKNSPSVQTIEELLTRLSADGNDVEYARVEKRFTPAVITKKGDITII